MPRFLLPILYLIISISAIAGGNDMAIAVNNSITETQMSRSFARQLFGMKARQWSDGSTVKVFVLPDQASQHVSFAKEILEIFPYRLRSAWDRQVYSGTGQAPSEVSTIEGMQAKLASTPGAVGYLPKDKIDGVKIHMVEVY